MATIARIRVSLTGAQGLPGVCTFYALDPVTAVPALHAFWTQQGGRFPTVVSTLVEPTGDLLNESTGEAIGSWATTPVAAVDNVGAGSYAAPVGLSISWVTGTFIGGRRVRGRTFIVPMVSSLFENDGTPTFATTSGLQGNGTTLIAAVPGNMLVWHRPTPILDAQGNPTGEFNADGTGVAITSCTVADKAAVLRSRRD